MDDEIEAFMSVYAEDVTLDTHNFPGTEDSSFVHNMTVTARPRGALDPASCFVEAQIGLLFPPTYPYAALPSVEVQRVSGLNDEGKELEKRIRKFLEEEVQVGEDVLFPLMEAVLDYLDSVNDGECLICLSSLLVSPNSSTLNPKAGSGTKPCALRTPCYHCFHVHCLTRWGAMHISNEHMKAMAAEEGTAEGRAGRALQGDLKSLELQLERLESTISIREDQLTDLSQKIEAAGGVAQSSSQSLVSDQDRETYASMSLKELEDLLESLHTQQSFIKSRLGKVPKGKALISLQEDLQNNDAKQTVVQEYATRLQAEGGGGGNQRGSSLSQLRARQQQLEQAVEEDLKKKNKLMTRITHARAAVDQAETQQQAKQKERIVALVDTPFPCPCCRTPLSDCLPQDRMFFRNKMKNAFSTYADNRPGDTYASSSALDGSSDSGSGSGDSSASVSMLSPDLQKLVRSIQHSQATMRASLSSRAQEQELEKEQDLKPNYALQEVASSSSTTLTSSSVPCSDDFSVVTHRKGKVHKQFKGKCDDRDKIIDSSRLPPHPPPTQPQQNPIASDSADMYSDKDAELTNIDEEDDIAEAIRLSLLSVSNGDSPATTASDVYQSLYSTPYRPNNSLEPGGKSSGNDVKTNGGMGRCARPAENIKLAVSSSCGGRVTDTELDRHGGGSTSKKSRKVSSRGGVRGGYTFDSTVTPNEAAINRGKVPVALSRSQVTRNKAEKKVEKKEDEANRGVETECLCCGDTFDSSLCLYAIGACNHAAVCGVCALRSRLLVKDRSCVICRQPLEVVVCTSVPDTPFVDQLAAFRRASDSYNNSKSSSSAKKKSNKNSPASPSTYYTPAQVWAPDKYMSSVLTPLLHYTCPVCHEVLGDLQSLRHIQRHLLTEHDLRMCEVCTSCDNRHLFASELQSFAPAALQTHMKGEGSGMLGHPLCDLCNKHVFDADALLHHVTDNHYCCYICELSNHTHAQTSANLSQGPGLSYSAAASSSSSMLSSASLLSSSLSRAQQSETHIQSLLTNTFAGTSSSSPLASTTAIMANYFKSKADLHEHFRREHHCCKLCKKMREVVVFSTEVELTAHLHRSHPSSSSRGHH